MPLAALHYPLTTNHYLLPTMQYEVEQKFPVADMRALETKLIALGAEISPPHSEVDLYFAHPSRDFAETDEALRIRRKGTECFITYKGPKIDQTTKTRRELELPLEAESFEGWTRLLQALGFAPVAEVRKSRRKAEIPWQDRQVEGSLDDVEGVGTFFELELIVDEGQIEAAKACLASLADALELAEGERRSYLELLLECS